MPVLLSLDPGGAPRSTKSRSATGYSLWHFDAITPLRPITHGQVQGNEDVFLSWWQENVFPIGWESDKHWNPDEIVCESFRIDGRTPFPDTTPLKIEGMLKVLVETRATAYRPPLTFQPNTAKASAPDDLLKRLGFWWSGLEHARDSARHALHYARAINHAPTIRAFWPPRAA